MSNTTIGHTQNQYSKEELIECGYGRLFGDGNAQLPLDKMLMVDRITTIDKSNGLFERGQIIAELDINPDLWFFACHFHNDPVMPGCLGLDAMWQLVGFYLGWLGNKGRGRALGVGDVRFTGQVKPSAKRVTYQIDLKRVVARRLIFGIADGKMFVDGEKVYDAKDLRVGLFSDS